MLELLPEPLLDAAIKKAVETLANKILDANQKRRREHKDGEYSAKVVAVRTASASALLKHLQFVRNWSASFKLSEMPAKRSVTSVFLELDTYAKPLRTQGRTTSNPRGKPLLAILESSNDHTVVLGQPGAGKSTSMQKIGSDFFVKHKALKHSNFPLVIRLRDISTEETSYPILTKLQAILALATEFTLPEKTDKNDSHVREIEMATLVAYLDSLSCLLVLDGFDEIPDPSTRKAAYSDIKRLSESLHGTRLIVTSRTSDFPYELVNATTLEISSLSTEQVETFARKWFSNVAIADKFSESVLSSPYADAVLRPLTLAQLCAVYEQFGGIPEKPTDVSIRILSLLIDDWDKQRGIERRSSYARFHRQRKREFLAALAYTLATKFSASRFSTFTMQQAYLEIFGKFGLPHEEADLVVKEVESHTGLIVESGYGHFEFSHKSLQEYLAAEHIVRMPSLALTYPHLVALPNELAIATALSSLPEEYFAEIVLGSLQVRRAGAAFLESYMGRMHLEKPDLSPSTDAGIAAAIVLTRCNNVEANFALLRTVVPNGISSAMMASGFYVLDNGNDLSITFQLREQHPRFDLPPTIVIPNEVACLGES